MTVEEKLERLTGIVDSLAGSVVHHDDQIEANSEQIGQLIAVAEKQNEKIAKVSEQIAQLSHEWQAYLRTLRPQ